MAPERNTPAEDGFLLFGLRDIAIEWETNECMMCVQLTIAPIYSNLFECFPDGMFEIVNNAKNNDNHSPNNIIKLR